ncbi:TetR/AcrR family transcriptional regulator [Amnibacterium flavum]|uniref:TetR/AcrR family transcriptional regulator n=1 Tax=Amnibacterium flavum TaxID=2173173 RepID=UPI001402915A|nr:TetR/AcrR family transcriptional regulator [Amnibacterium flavum]
MNDSSGLGLRERKRAQTAEAIHIAAAELVLENGLDETTIDAISARADVSNRTFFNYFPSKEDAVLGIDEGAVAAELDKVHDTQEDPLAAVFDLIYAIFEASGGKQRKELSRAVIRKHPQLMTRQMARVADLEDRLSEIIAGWLRDDERFADDTDAERLEQARLILGICLSTVRISMRRWAGHDHSGSGAGSSDTPDPRKIYERAIATLRTVMEKLS